MGGDGGFDDPNVSTRWHVPYERKKFSPKRSSLYELSNPFGPIPHKSYIQIVIKPYCPGCRVPCLLIIKQWVSRVLRPRGVRYARSTPVRHSPPSPSLPFYTGSRKEPQRLPSLTPPARDTTWASALHTRGGTLLILSPYHRVPHSRSLSSTVTHPWDIFRVKDRSENDRGPWPVAPAPSEGYLSFRGPQFCSPIFLYTLSSSYFSSATFRPTDVRCEAVGNWVVRRGVGWGLCIYVSRLTDTRGTDGGGDGQGEGRWVRDESGRFSVEPQWLLPSL